MLSRGTSDVSDKRYVNTALRKNPPEDYSKEKLDANKNMAQSSATSESINNYLSKLPSQAKASIQSILSTSSSSDDVINLMTTIHDDEEECYNEILHQVPRVVDNESEVVEIVSYSKLHQP